ncbi:hypothetical protein [Actinoplanes sp. NPDC048796]|uniref:hypothetical protein n=1 Tax=Actinoplanes sp. NPDC048796 TaxID=3155640 RepID=UPI0033C8BC04
MTVHELARALPDIAVLRDRCRVLATLEAIIEPDWEYRYYSFDSRWSPGEQMAAMSNGAGDEWSIVFSPAGAFVRGFDHESPMSPAGNDDELWPGLVDTVPEVFSACVAEPAFSFDGVLKATVCLWRQHADERWHTGELVFPAGDDPDGAGWLFQGLVEGSPEAYQKFAEDYHERPVDLAAVAEIFAMRPLTDDLVRRLNADLRLADLAEDLAEIGCSSWSAG